MKRLFSLILLVVFFAGCSGTFYSRKKIPINIKNIDATLYGKLGELGLSIDIERCKSDAGSDECYKILNAIHNGSVNVEGVNWDNFEIIIKEK